MAENGRRIDHIYQMNNLIQRLRRSKGGGGKAQNHSLGPLGSGSRLYQLDLIKLNIF